ncbi:putative disease resistance protein RGA3 [Typha angustifolia]|uniref:putative disease resistance protein RGA3 n=1 Tax=Typha angustifolia TaxID=59011 RepID=UPI003C30C74A
MAELALASAILRPVIDKLASETWKQLELFCGLDGDLNNLHSTLKNINGILHAAERRSQTDENVQIWLQELKDLAYDADDVLDSFQVESVRRSSDHYITRKVRDFFTADNQIAFRYEMAKQINRINERLKIIDEDKNRFQFPVIEVSVNTGVSYSESESSSATVTEANELYGRDEDKEKIISFLLETESDKRLSIYPIVGLGGVGKTSLVQMVLKDERIREAFQPPSSLRPFWVCVGEAFFAKEIASKIIECVTLESCDLSAIEPMRSKLTNLIGGRKILLVLDDVWNEDVIKWEGLISLIICAGSGSKVIVTTRSDEVARITCTTNSHRLDVLEFEHCWKLFSHMAFQIGAEKESPRLVETGKEIVKKCGGLPLAAKALGALMASRNGEDEWLEVRDSEIWEISRNDHCNAIKILPALRLSYEHMPSHMKQCFLYCSLFPKNYLLDKKKLIELWISEGFISPSSKGMHPKVTGNSYFNYLLRRSFFQNEVKYEHGDVTCNMHDLIHDLACYIAGPEFSARGKMVEKKDKWRYLSVDLSAPSETRIEMEAIAKAKKLRSFLSVHPPLFFPMRPPRRNINLDILSGFSYLRLLDLTGHQDIKELPSSIVRLKHLRVIDLSSSMIETLPESISRLRSLQMLKLADCWKLKRLPQGMRKMTSLRILDVFNCHWLVQMPPGMGRLTELEILSIFVVRHEPGCSIVELQQLNLLRGKLEIKCLNIVKDAEEARSANLCAKKRLQSLKLSWNLDNRNLGGTTGRMTSLKAALPELTEDVKNDVLESLQPPPHLEELEIDYYDGSRFPSWITGIQNLVKVTLRGLERCKCLPPLGNLPQLKSLQIYGMDAVTEMGREFYGDGGSFPSLENLILDEMPLLEHWCTISETATFPYLSRFDISNCPLLTVQPCLPPAITQMKIYKSSDQAPSESNDWDGLPFLTALEELTIFRVLGLVSLPMSIMEHSFSSLRTLILCNLPSFTSLGMDLETQEETPFLCFPTLQRLEIRECNRLTTLPKWLGCLTSLKCLQLEDCKNLAALPEGLQRVTSLHQLHIERCPLLVSRCEEEEGEDWHKIAHVPRLIII